MALWVACLGAGCSESDGSGTSEPAPEPVPPFKYSLYLKGTTPNEGTDVVLARRPDHLEFIYAQRFNENEAGVLFTWLEDQFRDSGTAFADATALLCGLDLPVRCTPDWRFIDEILGHSNGPGSRHLRQVLADAFSKQARKRRLDTALALSIANAVLARGQLKAAMGKAVASAESRAAAGAARRMGVEGAVEGRAAAVGAERLVAETGRLRAPVDVSAIQARLVDAEALEASPRQTAVLADLARLRPSLDRPPSGVSTREGVWREYVTYWERRFVELSGPEARSSRIPPPLTWEGYSVFRMRFKHALAFERDFAGLLRREADRPRRERQFLREMERPRVDENVGLGHKDSTSRTYVDQLVVDEATLRQGTPRVESYSVKQRDFTRMDPNDIADQVRADAREAAAKYGGSIEVRRPGHPLFERRVVVSRVHLVYDEGMIPDLAQLRRQMVLTAKSQHVELHFHHER